MDYSPKLKKAAEEIKQVLMKYDIAGVVALHTPGFGEYITHITPTYSCAKIDELKGAFELRGKKIHFSSPAEHYNKLNSTCNMLRILSTITGNQALALLKASEVTDEALNAEHGETGHTSSTQQQN
jgi:hypothetical protein